LFLLLREQERGGWGDWQLVTQVARQEHRVRQTQGCQRNVGRIYRVVGILLVNTRFVIKVVVTY
jgi:hypothetical protein